MAAEPGRDRSVLYFTGSVRAVDVHHAKANDEQQQSGRFYGGAAAKNHAGLYAAFHRLHQFEFSERSGYLFGRFQLIPDGAAVYHVS